MPGDPHGTPTEDFEDLYENAPCGYLSLRPDGRIFKSNATLSGWIGFSQAELLGKKLHELLTIAGRVFYETHFSPLLRMQGFFNEVALDLVTKDGKKLPVLANAMERRDDAGNLLFTRVTIFQAAQRRRYERNLVDLRTAAEAAKGEAIAAKVLAEAGLTEEQAVAELREQFIAVLGHDLRNPLASINAGTRMLLQEELSDRAQKIVALMQGSVSRMSDLIDNVLDFAQGRLGGGITVALDAREPLEPVLQQVVDELRVGSPSRLIETHFKITHKVYCDRGRIGQLASNLLGNALTHGAADTPIQFLASTTGEKLEISVVNGGDPIPPEAMNRLFHPFFRGDGRDSPQGLGLGLHIASEIAKAHDGTLVVASSPVETRFTFQMPLEPDGEG
ncbi:PAS/PAC sensor signal transduction histidine kinase [Phyllobacterium bourgognense]|uniref:histidine kinase n=1 Tax=Phyllobacterium bourgognense TaxID=314236 RepID=A0A368YIK5_9HYPH|nr:PAS/PAC sensor signal transduction histidine kinase [Phyllobacterium bourgognense]